MQNLTPLESFETHRSYLFGIAYRMLGSVMEAEDIVQETYLRYQKATPGEIRSLRPYLSKITTRLCLDLLKSARVQRESYIGPWLPEPLITQASPARIADRKEDISMAFMIMLERLTPTERAVFILREVFDYEYHEITAMLNISAANARQLYRRAKSDLVRQRPRFTPSAEQQRQLMTRFFQAVSAGDMEGLTTLLAEDVVHTSDGGGKVHAATRPLVGADKVAKFFLGIYRMAPPNMEMRFVEANGQQATLLIVDQSIMALFVADTDGEKIHEIHAVLNPDKLQHVHQVLVDF